MAYYLVRFYSGSGDRPPEQLIREVVDHELRPKLQEGGGLTRYITFYRRRWQGWVGLRL